MKHPKRLDTYTIVSKNEIKSLCDLSPVWHAYYDYNKALQFDEIAKKSDIILKVTYKRQTGRPCNIYYSFDVIKNVHNEHIIGKSPNDTETIYVNNTSYKGIELNNMTSEEDYNRNSMSLFLRRYMFSPDRDKPSKLSNHCVQYDFSALIPERDYSTTAVQKEFENYIFIIDFRNDCISSTTREDILKLIKNLPNV